MSEMLQSKVRNVSTHIGVGLDDHPDGTENGRRAVLAALNTLGERPPSLALLFTSHPAPERVLRGVNGVLDSVPLIGMTTAGQYTGAGYVERGTGIMLIQSEQIRFHLAAHQKRWFGGRRLLGQLHGISREGLGSAFKHRTLMLFPDDRSMNLDDVVERAMTETSLLYDILGGAGLSGQAPPRPPAVFFNDRLFRAGLSGVEMLSQKPLGLALASGWSPVSGPYRVTKADDRRVIALDGRPAWEVYEDFLDGRQITTTPETLHAVLLQYPIGICPNGDCKVRVLVGVDGQGALAMTSPPPTGSLVHILATQPDAMITAASRAIRHAQERLEAQPGAGALFIDCVSTGLVLADAYAQQRAAVERLLGDVPFLGVRSHGVLARLQGQTAGHYECSVATCLLPV